MTGLLLIFGVTLLAAVVLSALAQRSVLSTAVLFLAVGFVAGPGVLNLVPVAANHALIETFAEVAIFAVLYAEGMRVDLRRLASSWRLPAAVLGIGLPVTLALNGLLASALTDLPWTEAFLLGAVLSPTDPVLASALIGRREVPLRLRQLLNVESGVNDGLALPAVILLAASAMGSDVHPLSALREVLMGVAVGLVVPAAAIAVERAPGLGSARLYDSLHGVAIALIVFALCRVMQGNEFLAAFVAGVIAGNLDRDFKTKFSPLGDAVGETLKLGTLLVFGAAVTPAMFAASTPSALLFAALVLVVVRPLAIGLILIRGGFSRVEWLAAVWFGPKGFASAYYALLIAGSGIDHAGEIFRLAAIVVAASVIAHSSTDVPIVRRFGRQRSADQATA